jgi:hypothetical protein
MLLIDFLLDISKKMETEPECLVEQLKVEKQGRPSDTHLQVVFVDFHTNQI